MPRKDLYHDTVVDALQPECPATPSSSASIPSMSANTRASPSADLRLPTAVEVRPCDARAMDRSQSWCGAERKRWSSRRPSSRTRGPWKTPRPSPWPVEVEAGLGVDQAERKRYADFALADAEATCAAS